MSSRIKYIQSVRRNIQVAIYNHLLWSCKFTAPYNCEHEEEDDRDNNMTEDGDGGKLHINMFDIVML